MPRKLRNWHRSRVGERLVEDTLAQDRSGRSITELGPCCAVPGEAESPGDQHQGANTDFLTLPEAIRAAEPHLELKGELRRQSRGRGTGAGLFRLCYPDPSCPKIPIQSINALVFLLLVLPLNAWCN